MTKNTNTVPQGWLAAGSNPKDYEFSLDSDTFYKGTASGLLQTKKKKPTGFGTLMQEFQAEKYRGNRMRFSAYVKAKDVEGWSGLWMRIEGPGHEILGFDNMKNRAIVGTSDWKQYEIVLDVPQESKVIAFGILLSGRGSVWIDEVIFEEVANADVTNMEKPLPKAPVNLNFQSS